MAKTIKEIADELGVDKQKVYRFIKKSHINEAHHEALQNRINEAVFDTVSETLIDMLRKELEIQNEQIRDLNARLAESNAALVAAQQTAQAAQALHAGTIQQQLTAESAEQEDPPEERKNWLHRIFRK